LSRFLSNNLGGGIIKESSGVNQKWDERWEEIIIGMFSFFCILPDNIGWGI